MFPALVVAFFTVDGPHVEYREIVREIGAFVVWWVGLGVASSVGLGTGLHTFVLYLGPYIAKVAMVANECNKVPEFLPSKFAYQSFAPCEKWQDKPTIGIFDIYLTVALEAFLFGLGTAIGELPPYFVARAASLAGEKHEELDEQEGIFAKARDILANLLKNHAFLVVTLCASIPNPFFDLAGLTCGHFLISFWTFFGATVLGKACIKISLQAFLIIIAFSKQTVDKIIAMVGSIHPPAEGFLQTELLKQKEKLYQAKDPDEEASLLSVIWSWIVALMIGYFVYAFLNAIIQDQLKKDLKKNKH